MENGTRKRTRNWFYDCCRQPVNSPQLPDSARQCAMWTLSLLVCQLGCLTFPSLFFCSKIASICKLFLSFRRTCFNVHLFTFHCCSIVCLFVLCSFASCSFSFFLLSIFSICLQFRYKHTLFLSSFELICWDRQKALFTFSPVFYCCNQLIAAQCFSLTVANTN